MHYRFPNEAKKLIERDIDNNKYLLRPRNNCYKIDISSKKNLVNHLKTKFCNNYNLVETAKMNTRGTPTFSQKKKINTRNILKDGVTIEDVDNYLKEEKLNERMTILRQMCYELLNFMEDRIDNKNKKLITEYIESINNIGIINTVINTLSINYFFRDEMTYELLMDKIKLNHEMKKLIIY
jgi:hypothetical protein